MAVNIGDLVARLRADLSQWERGFSDAERTTKTFSDRFGRILETGIGVSIGLITTKIAQESARWVKELSKLGLEAKVQEHAFAALAAAAGQSSERLIARMQAASGSILNVSDAMQAASRAMVQGFDETQIVRVMEAARQLSKIAGKDVVEAFNDITIAVTTGMTRQLKSTYGVVIDAEQAVKDFAEASGRAAEDVTELGRSQAILARFFAQSEQSVRALTTAERSESEQVQRLTANIKQLKEDLGKLIPHGELAAAAADALEAVRRLGQGLTEIAHPYVIAVKVTWDFGVGVFDSIVGSIEAAMDAAETAMKSSPFGKWLWEKLMGSPEAIAAAKRGAAGTVNVPQEGAREIARAAGMAGRQGPEEVGTNAFAGELFRGGAAVPQFEGVLSLSEALREAAVAADLFARAGEEVRDVGLAEVLADAESQARGLQDTMDQLNAEGAALMELPAGWLPTGTEQRWAKAVVVMGDLDEQLKRIDAKAKVLGPDFDRVAARIQALTSGVEALISEGLEPGSEQVVRLQTELKGLEQFQSLKGMFQDIFGSVSGAISKAVEGVILGTQKMKDAFRNLGQYIIAEFAARVIRQALNPIMDALASIAAGIFQSLLNAAGVAAAQGGAGSASGFGSAAGAFLAAGGAAALGAGAAALGGAGLISPGTAGAAGIFGGAAQLYGASGINATQSLLQGRLVQDWGAPGLASMAGLGGAAGIIGGGLMFSGNADVQRLGAAISSLQLLTITNPVIGAITSYATSIIQLYTAVTDLMNQEANQGAAIGTIVGQVIGGVLTLGLGTAIGGAIGGFIGGLFGRTGLSREVRDAIQTQRVLGQAASFQGELAGTKNVAELYGKITAYQSGYVGGTSPLAIPGYFPNVPIEQLQALVAGGQVLLPGGATSAAAYAQRAGYAQGPGGYQGVPVFPGTTNANYPVFAGMQSFFDFLRENQDLFTVGIQAGVKPGNLTQANAAIRDTILSRLKFFDDLQREIIAALDDLLKVTVTPPDAQTFSAALLQEAEAFGEILVTLRQHSQENIDAARAELLTMTDPRAFLDQTTKIRGLIEDRYQGEITLVQRWAGQMQQIAGAWDTLTASIAAQRQALSLGGFGPTNPSERVAVVRASFEETLAQFRAAPTIELGQQVSSLAEPFLQAASEQFTRPSTEFRAIFDQVQAALAEVQALGGTRQQEINEAIQQALGEGVTIASLTAENTAQMAADLSALLAETQALVTGMGWIFDPAYGQQQLTNEQIQIALLGQIAANTMPGSQPNPAAAADAARRAWEQSFPGLPWPGMGGAGGGTPTYPTYQHGTSYVPETGPAFLHAGEMIVSAPEAERLRATGGGVILQVGDIHVTGAADPEATARAVVDVLERRLRAPGRLRAAVRDVAKGA